MQSEIQNNIFSASPSNQDGLVVMYNFGAAEVSQIGSAAGEQGKVRSGQSTRKS